MRVRSKQEIAATEGAKILYDFSTTQWQGADLDKLKEHLVENIDLISQYPIDGSKTLSRLLSRRLDVKEENIIVTNGTTGAFHLAARVTGAGTKSMVLTPCSPGFTKALRRSGHEIIEVEAPKELNKLSLEGVGMLWISNPNSPDGRFYSRRSLLSALREHPDVLFVVDISMDGYVVEDNLRSTDTRKYKNLIIVSSYSQAFNIPGLRIGYMASEAGRIEHCLEEHTPGTISSLAFEAVRYILLHPALFTIPIRKWLRDSVELADELSNIEGLNPLPSCTPFFIVELEGVNVAELAAYLEEEHRIKVGTAADGIALEDNQVRISALPGATPNEALVEAVRAFVEERLNGEESDVEQ